MDQSGQNVRFNSRAGVDDKPGFNVFAAYVLRSLRLVRLKIQGKLIDIFKKPGLA